MKSLAALGSAFKKIESSIMCFKGFKLLLAWHYVVLFSPLLAGMPDQESSAVFFERQVILYSSIAGAFVVFMLLGKRLRGLLQRKTPYALFVLMGLLAAAATLLAVLSATRLTEGLVMLRVPITAFLGLSEALLMYLWLHFYTRVRMERFHHKLAVDMIAGALMGFLVCNMLPPLSYTLVVLMPCAATLSLVMNWGLLAQGRKAVEVSDLNPPRKVSKRHVLKIILPSIVFAFVFGLLQGDFFAADQPLLMVGNPLSQLGIVLAGLCVLVLSRERFGRCMVDMLHRLALLLFVIGVMGLSVMRNIGPSIVSETAILAGFNLFDFGMLIISMRLAQQLRLGSPFFIDFGRVLVYLGFSFGLAAGFVGALTLAPLIEESSLNVLTAVSAIMIIATVLVSYHDVTKELEAGGGAIIDDTGARSQQVAAMLEPIGRNTAAQPAATGKNGETPQNAPFKRLLEEVARTYRLSPRELEVFMLIAKGRNAEYIQQSLFISHHTAKTHIANIYHKLEVHSVQEMLTLIESFKDPQKPRCAPYAPEY
ncbi:MAG: LuxR C-terminal-related transcriptional regulator [Coriobacteriales bacterium]|jgi:DNA-binding CsgD family transcriptional regulator|nr:LuxR C-terminal-related transcriptional regulator [Coriobacteriales bacterium]